MKNSSHKSTIVGLSVLLGALTQVSAIERPGEKTPEVAPVTPAPAPLQQVDKQNQKQNPVDMPQVAEVKQGFLGVSGDPVNEALMLHLNLNGGLHLNYVSPDSPAKLAGLLKHDILTGVDDLPTRNQIELRDAVSKKRAGDEVVVKLIRKGKAIEQKVTLGERPIMPPQANAGRVIPQGLGGGRGLQLHLGNGLAAKDQLELQRQLLKQLDQAWDMNGGIGPDQMKLKLNDLFEEEDFNLGLKSSGSITFSDQDGSIEMRSSNGSRELSIRDLDGNLLFEGPYDTDIDKAAVPEDLRDRVEALGLDGEDNNGARMFHFEFKGGAEPEKKKKD